MNTKIEVYIDELIERHMATGFMDYNLVEYLKTVLVNKEEVGRKEILLFAYLIGANANEANELLEIAGYMPLYVKRREDAIWRFALNHQVDAASIIDEIFPQNVVEQKNAR